MCEGFWNRRKIRINFSSNAWRTDILGILTFYRKKIYPDSQCKQLACLCVSIRVQHKNRHFQDEEKKISSCEKETYISGLFVIQAKKKKVGLESRSRFWLHLEAKISKSGEFAKQIRAKMAYNVNVHYRWAIFLIVNSIFLFKKNVCSCWSIFHYLSFVCVNAWPGLVHLYTTKYHHQHN